MTRLSTDEAFGRIKAKHPNIEILSKSYATCHSKLVLKCKVCSYEWRATYANVSSQNTGCPKCAGKLKFSTDEAFGRIKVKHPNIEILSKKYKGACASLRLKCKKCGCRWKTSYASLIHKGTQCPKCARKPKFSADEAFGHIKAKHPNIEILSDRYANCDSKLDLKCKVCGNEWKATYSNLVNRGSRCPKCVRNLNNFKKRLPVIEAFGRIKAKHPNIQVLSKKYIGNYKPLNLKCKICKHKWQASYGSLVYQGTRCPKCARKMTKGEKHIFDLLVSCGLVYCSSLEEALAHEKRRLKCINN